MFQAGPNRIGPVISIWTFDEGEIFFLMNQNHNNIHKNLNEVASSHPSHYVESILINHANGGASLVVQWLRLHAPSAGGLGSTPGQETRPHIPQLRVYMLQVKISHTANKTRHSQINKYFFLNANRDSQELEGELNLAMPAASEIHPQTL